MTTAPTPITSPSAAAWPWRRPRGLDPRAAAAAARRRGLIQAVVGWAVAALLLLWKPLLAAVVASIALLVALLALLSPVAGFATLERWVDRFAHAVGTAVTWLLLPLLFFLFVLPAGLLLRRGRLRFTGNPDAALPTYWRRPERPADERWQGDGVARYRRQF